MNEQFDLSQAFKALDDLNEQYFPATQTGIDSMGDYMSGEVDDTVKITDVEATSPEQLKDNYVGKVILDCTTCHSLVYKDKSDIELDEETGYANIDEECPVCATMGGFTIVGEVAEYCPECDEEKVDNTEAPAEEAGDEVSDAGVEDDDLVESKQLKHNKNQEAINRLLKKLDQVNESVEEVEVKADGQKVKVKPEDDKTVVEISNEEAEAGIEADTEVIKPLSDEDKEEIVDSNEMEADLEPEEAEEEFDEFDEESFDDLSEQYLKEVYDNVKAYKTTKASTDGNKIKLEGVITFNSGKKGKSTYIFEAQDKLKNGKLRFVGMNEALSKNSRAFSILGNNVNKKFISESLTYNYNVKKRDDKSERLYGRVKRK